VRPLKKHKKSLVLWEKTHFPTHRAAPSGMRLEEALEAVRGRQEWEINKSPQMIRKIEDIL